MLQQLSVRVPGSSGDDDIIYLQFGDVIGLYADLVGCSDAQAFARQGMTSKDWRCGAGLAQGTAPTRIRPPVAVTLTIAVHLRA